MTKYRDEEWLREQYWEQDKSIQEVAEATDVSGTTIKRWMDRLGVETESLSSARADGDVEHLHDRDWLREQYVESGRTMADIAAELDVYDSTVHDWLQRHDLPVRSEAAAKADGEIRPLQDEAWLREQYVEQHRTTYEIGADLGVAPNTVRRYLHRHGIEVRSRSAAQTSADVTRLQDEEWLRAQYCEYKRTIHEIGDQLGVSGNTVSRWLHRHGIDVRDGAEAQTDADIELLRDEGWLREQYWEHDRALNDIADEVGCCARTVVLYMEGHGIERRESFAVLAEATDPDDLPHVVRSDWELEVARLLRDNDIRYEYEALTIEYDDGRTYTPDFVTDEYVIEVKGRLYESSNAERKARAAMESLTDREYVVVGTRLPADHHFIYDNRLELVDLLDDT